jgi:hypothetical protein
MLNQIKFVAFLVGALVTSVYAGKPPLKEERAVYTVRYWDRAMAPDEKKEWRFYINNLNDLSVQADLIVAELNSRFNEMNRSKSKRGEVFIWNLSPISQIRSAIDRLLTEAPVHKKEVFSVWIETEVVWIGGDIGFQSVALLKKKN